MDVVLIVLISVLIAVLVDFLVCKVIVKLALRKFVKPFIAKKGWEFLDYRVVGSLSKGDFGKKSFVVRPVPRMGNIANTTYIYVFARTEDGTVIPFTTEIVSFFLFIKKVEYKSTVIKGL